MNTNELDIPDELQDQDYGISLCSILQDNEGCCLFPPIEKDLGTKDVNTDWTRS